MFGIGSKKRRQNCLLLTEDGRILNIAHPVVKGYVVSDKTAEAWGLIPDSCIQERGTKKLYQVITERDCAPVSLNGKNNSSDMKTMMSKIAQEHASDARADIQRKSLKNKYHETLLLMLLIFAITIGVLVVFGLFASGKLHMPGSGGGGESGVFSSIPVWLKQICRC
jgi:hypothetical protein